MFIVNEDNSIYATRGDIVFFSVTADDDGKPYKFQAGDVVRIKVYGKKDAESVVLQKDFPVFDITESVEIYLTEEDTKFGEVISKPKDYWYEVELNPYDNPQTIIGYDEDGAKVFKLFPEGDDVPPYVPEPEDLKVIDEELDMTSERPVQNQAIARAFENLVDGYERTRAAVEELYVTPQMYGANGDGETDDTEAIQACINENFMRTAICFPKGTYRVTAPIVFPEAFKHTRVFGEAHVTIQCDHNGDCFVLSQSDPEAGSATFENLLLTGPNPTYSAMSEKVSTGAGFNMKSVYHTKFRNVRCSGFKYGIYLEKGIGNTFESDCYFRFNEYGVYLCGNATNMNRFDNCNIRENWVCGVYIGSDTTSSMNAFNIFNNCYIESNVPFADEDKANEEYGYGVRLTKTGYNIFDNCYLENHRRAFCFNDWAHSNTITNCYFSYNKENPIVEFTGTSIKNNVFSVCNNGVSNNEVASVVVTTEYNGMGTNRFVRCGGLNIKQELLVSKPIFVNCVSNINSFGNNYSRLNAGATYQNPGGNASPVSPYIEGIGTTAAILHTMGLGDIQLGSQITAETSITSIDEMQRGDVVVINNYQNKFPVHFIPSSAAGSGSLKLKGNTTATLQGHNETIVFYCNYLGQVVELCRNF